MNRVVGKKTKVAYALEPWSLVGQGVEGRVYSASGRCVKVFSAPLPADQVEKIEALSRLGRNVPGVAWPTEVVADSVTGYPVGFVMDLVPGETLESLLDRRGTGDIDLGTKVTLALQVANAVAAAHEQRGPKVVMGDVLKAANLVVDVDSTSAVFVDSASVSLFSFRVSNGHVQDAWSPLNTPGYVPKEVLENPGAIPSHDADCFALAVLVFELLFGKPPHEPKPSPGAVGLEPDDAIRRGIFLRWVRHAEFQAPTYDDVDLPDSVESLFRAAFLASARRPTSGEWAEALSSWVAELTPPPESDEGDVPAPQWSPMRWGTLERISVVVLAAWILLSLVQLILEPVVPGGITKVVPLPQKLLGPSLFRELFK